MALFQLVIQSFASIVHKSEKDVEPVPIFLLQHYCTLGSTLKNVKKSISGIGTASDLLQNATHNKASFLHSEN